jgi:hypothetical protein
MAGYIPAKNPITNARQRQPNSMGAFINEPKEKGLPDSLLNTEIRERTVRIDINNANIECRIASAKICRMIFFLLAPMSRFMVSSLLRVPDLAVDKFIKLMQAIINKKSAPAVKI